MKAEHRLPALGVWALRFLRSIMLVGLVVASASVASISCKSLNHSSAQAYTDANDGVGKKLYPDDEKAQSLVENLFIVLDSHKKKTPYPDRKGPGISGFSMNELPIGLYINTTELTTDLLIVNWTGVVPREFLKADEISRLIGRPAYLVKDLERRSLRTINEDKETFFESLFGSDFFEEDDGTRANYLPETHFLRRALGKLYMPLVVPYGHVSPADLGILNVIVHEAYHIFENRQRLLVLNDSSPYLGPMSDDAQLKTDLNKVAFQRLIGAYEASVIEAINETDGQSFSLKNVHSGSKLHVALSRIAAIMRRLETQFPQSWQTYIFYEYTEGLTEFAAAQSMIDAALVSYKDQVKREIFEFTDVPMFYRTGVFGGLFMRQTVSNFAWRQGYGYDPQGIWQKLIKELGTNLGAVTDEALDNYIRSVPDLTERIKLLKERF